MGVCYHKEEERQSHQKNCTVLKSLMISEQLTRDKFIDIMNEVKTQRETFIVQNRTEAFKVLYKIFLTQDDSKFEKGVIEQQTKNANLENKLIQIICSKHNINREQIDAFLMDNFNDQELQNLQKEVFCRDCVQESCDVEESRMIEIMKYAADEFNNCATKWENEAYQVGLAWVHCCVYQKFGMTELEFERASCFFLQQNPSKYRWYHKRLSMACRNMNY